MDARIGPRGSLENLSQAEIEKLLDSRAGGLYPLFRKCALAVLNSGSETDNAKEIFDRYKDFEVELVRQAWGIKLEIKNAPGQAFVDGEMIRGMKEHVFAVLRDVDLHQQRDHRKRPVRSRQPGGDHQRRVPHPAQRADSRLQVEAQPRGVLGRPLDRHRGIPVHQEGGLRARPARPRRLHGLRPGRHEGPDEGRHHRPRQAAHRRRPLHRPHRARHHRRRAAESDRQPAR